MIEWIYKDLNKINIQYLAEVNANKVEAMRIKLKLREKKSKCYENKVETLRE